MRRLLLTFLLCSTWMVGQSKISDNQIRTPPPLQCSDTTTSGTTQTCTTAPSFTPAAKDCVTYNTTTTNTGALTLNVNSQGAKPVQKWLGSALVAGDVVANKPQLACYDGTNWQLSTIGNAPSAISTPVSVANGGTGATTLTIHGVVVGNTTSAVNITSAGTSGQVLTSNGASADPTFQAAAGGGTITYGGLYCKASSNGAGPATCSTTYNVVANHIIIGTCGSFVGNSGGTDTMTFADTGPGGGSALTWTQADTAFDSTGQIRTAIFWANPGAATGSDTFTCTDSLGAGAINFWAMTVNEIVGATVASPIDAHANKNGASTQTISMAPTSTGDLTIFAHNNSGAFTAPANLFFMASDTSVSAFVGYGIAGPYHLTYAFGTHGAVTAVAIH